MSEWFPYSQFLQWGQHRLSFIESLILLAFIFFYVMLLLFLFLLFCPNCFLHPAFLFGWLVGLVGVGGWSATCLKLFWEQVGVQISVLNSIMYIPQTLSADDSIYGA